MSEVKDDDIEIIVRKTVHETLTALGMDLSNPVELQKDFAALREWRIAMHSVRDKGVWIIIATLIAGLLAATWVGLVEIVRR